MRYAHLMNRPQWRIIIASSLLTYTAVPAQTPPQVIDSVAILDANGKTVGHVPGPAFGQPIITSTGLSQPGNTSVVIAAGGQFVNVQITPDGFMNGTYGASPLRFESNDCTGQPYVDTPNPTPGPSFAPPATVAPPGHSVYLPSPTDTTPRTISQMSEMETDGRGCCMGCQSSPKHVVPVMKLTELDLYFSAPFRAVAAPPACCGDCNGNGAVTVDEILITVNNALTTCPNP